MSVNIRGIERKRVNGHFINQVYCSHITRIIACIKAISVGRKKQVNRVRFAKV